MYSNFFGLRERPFSAVCTVQHYYPATAIEAARRNLARTIDRGEGAGLLVGPPGTGKTLLSRLLAAELSRRLQVVLLSGCHPGQTRRELLQTLLFELELPYKGLDEGELRLSLMEFMLDTKLAPDGILLVVDEAHLLPIALLEELRMLSDVVLRGKPRLQVILVGTAALEESFALPQLEAFSQRLSARCYLQSFTREESRAYLFARLHSAGGDASHIFADEAMDDLHRASDGVPRILNQMADQALWLAAEKGVRWIDSALVDEVWGELQQLPTPWTDSRFARPATISSGAANVVEFGELTDLLDADQAEAAHDAEAMEATEPAAASFEFEPATGAPSPFAAADEASDFEQQDVAVDFNDASILGEQSVWEEEVVVDRYGKLDAALGAKRPVVKQIKLAGWEAPAAAQPAPVATKPVAEKTVIEKTAEKQVLKAVELTPVAIKSEGLKQLAHPAVNIVQDNLQILTVTINSSPAKPSAPPAAVAKTEAGALQVWSDHPHTNEDSTLIELHDDLSVATRALAAGLEGQPTTLSDGKLTDSSLSDSAPSIEVPAPRSHVSLHHPHSDDSVQMLLGEESLIVLDEPISSTASPAAPANPGQPPAVAAVPVRRGEYRRMFARLKHGSQS